MSPILQQLVNELIRVDRQLNYGLRRALGLLLIALFIGALCAMLYLWFQVMQPYPE